MDVDLGNRPFFTELSEESNNGPALTKKGNNLYIIWRATTNNVVYATSSDGGLTWTRSWKFTEKFQKATSDISATVFDGKVYAAWKEKDSEKFRVGYTSGTGDADTLMVKDTDGKAQKTKSGPCLIATDSKLYVFWRATTDHILYAYSSDGEIWSGDKRAAPSGQHHSSKKAPGAAVLSDGTRVMVYCEKDDDRIKYAIRDGSWGDSMKVGNSWQHTKNAPAVIGTSQGFVVCWKDRNNQNLRCIEYKDGSWSEAWTVKNPYDGSDEKTSSPPSLWNDDGMILVTWKRKDSKKICVATTGLWVY